MFAKIAAAIMNIACSINNQRYVTRTSSRLFLASNISRCAHREIQERVAKRTCLEKPLAHQTLCAQLLCSVNLVKRG